MSFDWNKNLKVIDYFAIEIYKYNNITLIVLAIKNKENIVRVVNSYNIGKIKKIQVKVYYYLYKLQ